MSTVEKRLGFSAHLAVLLTTLVGTNIGYTALLPYLPRLSAHLGLGPTGLAVFVTGFAVAKILGQPLGGLLADAWGLRATGVFGLATAVLGMALVAASGTAYPAILGRLIWGAADGILTPALYRALTVISAEHGRDPAGGYAKLGSAAVLSFAGGPFVVGLVHPFADYPAILATIACLTLANGVVAWLVFPDRARSAPADDAVVSASERLGPLLRSLVFFGVIDLTAKILWAAIEPLVPLYLGRTYQDATGRAALVLGLGMVMFAVANPLVARLGDRWRVPRLAGLGLVVLGLSCVALGGVAVLAVGLVAIAVFMVAQSYIYLVARTGIQRYCGGTGRAWGIFGMFSDAGLILGSLAGVFLFQTFGGGAFTILAVGAMAVGATLSTAVKGWRPQLQPQRTGS
jgi:MFS family permease